MINNKGTSRYKGVWFEERSQKWRTEITINGDRIYLGSFDGEITAKRYWTKAESRSHLYRGDKKEFKRRLGSKS